MVSFAGRILILFFCWSAIAHTVKLPEVQAVIVDNAGAANAERVRLVVFIHGAVGAELHFSNISSILSDDLTDDCWCVRVIARYRSHPILSQDQAIFDKGLRIISHEKITACQQGVLPLHEAQLGAYHVIAAYDQAQKILNKHEKVFYATFGWSGLISQKRRRIEGFRLYDDLIAAKEQLRSQYNVDPLIDIVAHSHGGNVALWLSDAESTYQKKLSIENLVLLGTPFQGETSHCLEASLFRSIISCHSRGDWVQTKDYFSTKGWRSYQTMSEIAHLPTIKQKNNKNSIRCDVQLVARHEPHRIDHTNMWMVGRSSRIFRWLDPLPFVVLVPLLITMINENPDPTVFLACFHGNKQCSLKLKSICPHGQYITLGESPDIYKPMASMAAITRNTWLTDDYSRNSFFSRRQMVALFYAWGSDDEPVTLVPPHARRRRS